MVTFILVTALSEAPASRDGEVVSGRQTTIERRGFETTRRAVSEDNFLFLLHRPSAVLVSSAFGFFGICGGRARRAASSHAASDCATDGRGASGCAARAFCFLNHLWSTIFLLLASLKSFL